MKTYIIVFVLYLCILWIYAQENKTLEFGVIAKPHPKGMNSIELICK
jgi:hypothetical protein